MAHRNLDYMNRQINMEWSRYEENYGRNNEEIKRRTSTNI
jgi:hypothetical protein